MVKAKVDDRPLAESLADNEPSLTPTNWVTLVDYTCNRLGIDCTTANPWWKERAALAGRLKKMAEKAGYTVEDVTLSVDYCAHYKIHVKTPMGPVSFVDTARQRTFTAAQKRELEEITKRPEALVAPRVAKLEAAWTAAVEAEVSRSTDDPEAAVWLARFERTAGHMRGAVLTEWRETRS